MNKWLLPIMISPDMQKGVLAIGSFQTWVNPVLYNMTSVLPFMSSLFSPQCCSACISEHRHEKLLSMHLHGYTYWFKQRIWHLCGASRTFSEYLSPFPSHCFFYLFLYFFQQPAPLNWRIWVTWITRGLLDTEAPSGNTPPLRALMMTWKVFILF